MSDINRVVLTGRLTRDPEKKILDSGKSLLRLTIASNRYAGPDKEDTLFMDAALFGVRADALEPILRKGMRIGIDGQLQQRSWQGEDGIKRTAFCLLVDRIELMEKKSNASPEPPPAKVEEEHDEDEAPF